MRILVLVALVTGCDLYWNGNGHSDDVCNGPALKEPAELLLDPSTGACQDFGGGPPPCPCGVECGGGDLIPNWPACFGPCSELAESACVATDGCHATYQPSTDRAVPQFLGCWNTTGIVSDAGTCAGLDAFTCAERDTCASLMTVNTGGELFASCIDEPPPLCLADADCPGGQSCDTTTCHHKPCPECPTCGACSDIDVCYGVCAATPCEQLATETACLDRTDCSAVYLGTDCTCDAQGHCQCQTETYDHCETPGKL